jgi:hypothetical protein
VAEKRSHTPQMIGSLIVAVLIVVVTIVVVTDRLASSPQLRERDEKESDDDDNSGRGGFVEPYLRFAALDGATALLFFRDLPI